MSDPVILGGRRFEVIDFERRSVRLDHYLLALVRDSGCDRILPPDGTVDDSPRRPEESETEYLARMATAQRVQVEYSTAVVMRAMEWGRVPELLGGYLMPHGMPTSAWSPSLAAGTAEFIAGLSTEEDRQAVIDLTFQVFVGFFLRGLARVATFPSSSGDPAASPAGPIAA